jgi:peptide/nickel transport system permease protein
MASFIIRRLIASIFVLFAATFLMYLLVSFSGDPLEDLRQSNAPNKAELMEARTKLLNLDVPPPLRYFLWLGALFRGDFGISIQNQSVNALLGNAITSTLTLVTTATIVAIVLGITVGIVSALRQYTGFDYGVTLMSFLFFSLPIFWVAVLLKQYGAIQLNNWLGDPTISVPVIIGMSIFAGLIWMSLVGGRWRRRLTVFGISAVATAAV